MGEPAPQLEAFDAALRAQIAEAARSGLDPLDLVVALELCIQEELHDLVTQKAAAAYR